jgi:hypothetical protein
MTVLEPHDESPSEPLARTRILNTQYASEGKGAVAYLNGPQASAAEKSIDVDAVIRALEFAISELRAGNGVEAAEYAGDAFAQLVLFHRAATSNARHYAR